MFPRELGPLYHRGMTALDFGHPDYGPIWRARLQRLARLRSIPGAIEASRRHYREHIADFIDDWGVTVDPRNAGMLGAPAVMPFTLFPKQREFVDWMVARWRGSEPGVLVKSRDCGASWLVMSVSVSLCLFWDDITIGFGSANEDKVDRSGDPDCLFYKGRMFMRYLPKEFKGLWDSKRKDNSAHMRLHFPDSNSSITGEGGDNIGLGGRKSIYIVDEFAVVEHPKLVETNLSANTNCCIELSTVRGIDNVFAEHARGGKIPRFDFSYIDDPRKVDPETKEMRPWFAKKVAAMDPVVFNQEYGCDFFASIEGGVIEAAWIQSAYTARAKIQVPEATGEPIASFDIADLGNDKNAVAIRKGIELVQVQHWSGSNINPMISIRKAFEIADLYGVQMMIYDASGMGGSWHEYFAIANREREALKLKPIQMQKFQGGAAVDDPDAIAPGTERTNKDYFENLKAQAWMRLRMRFVETHKGVTGEKFDPEGMIVINPKIALLNTLVGELAQPTRKWSKNSKLMIDKTPEGVASPNIADAVMMAFGQRAPWVFPDEIFEAI